MIKIVEKFCEEKRLRFGYGFTQAAADDFFELGGGVFVITQRPRVGYTEGVVMTRGVTDEDRAELVRRLRVNGSQASVDGSKINVRFRIGRPAVSGGAGIQRPTPPPPTKPSVMTGEATEVNFNSATFTATIENPSGVEITAKGFKYHKGAGAWVDVPVDSDEFTATVTGLDSESNYSVRAYIVYNGETINGEIVYFTTNAPTERETPFFVYHNESSILNVELKRVSTMDARTIEISLDGVSWEEWPESAHPIGGFYLRTIALSGGQRLYMRNAGSDVQKLGYSPNKYHNFSAPPLKCGGNMLSLLTKNFENLDTVGSGAFCKLFDDVTLDNMPKIFFNNAPSMVFYQTFSFARGEVELPAEVLEEQAYRYMFSGSTDITRIVLRARDISANSCLQDWLLRAEQSQTQGVIVCYPELNIPSGASGIPTSWTREDLVD